MKIGPTSYLDTRYQDDQEFNILFKQYEKHLLHAGEIELEIRSALEETDVNAVNDGEHYTRLGSHIKFKVVEGEVTLKSNEDWKGCITKDTFTSFLSGFGDVQGILYTEHNMDNGSIMAILSMVGKTGVEWTSIAKSSHAIY